MIIYKYLIVNSRGGITIREKEPKMTANEIALRLALEIPDAMFRRPVLRADIKVPQEAIPKVSITPEIRTNIEDMIKQATGLEMAVSLIEAAETQEDPEKEEGGLSKSS